MLLQLQTILQNAAVQYTIRMKEGCMESVFKGLRFVNKKSGIQLLKLYAPTLMAPLVYVFIIFHMWNNESNLDFFDTLLVDIW